MDWLFEGSTGNDAPVIEFDRSADGNETLSNILQTRPQDGWDDAFAGFGVGSGKLDVWAPHRVADGGNPGDVDVIGERDKWWEDLLDPPGGGNGGSSGDGGSGGDPPPIEPPCGGGAPNGPTPVGVDMETLRDLARSVASTLAALNGDWEWGSLIYTFGGQLFSTQPITQQSPDSIGFLYSAVPDGATIVAWVHTHPDIPGDPRQNGLSRIDNGARATMVDASNGRFSVDPALMTYVFDNETDDLLEFDEGDGEGSRGIDITPCGGI